MEQIKTGPILDVYIAPDFDSCKNKSDGITWVILCFESKGD